MTTHERPEPDSTRRVTIVRGREGWEVREEENDRVVRRMHFTDWHRVERAAGLHRPGASPESPGVLPHADDPDR
jgi:hypothetical protein